MFQINDLSTRLSKHKQLLIAAYENVLNSGHLILGHQVNQFEKAFAHYLNTAHCVGVANGTDALELALKALGIQQGDKVATVANAGMYTTTAILALSAEPFFMDIDDCTMNATLTEVKKAVAAGVKAVVITHLYGMMVSEIEAIASYCKKNKVFLLEDCAQAHGAKLKGQYAGNFSDVAAFSFYPTKNLGALGDGGAVVTHDENLYLKVKCLRQYGWVKKYQVGLSGARNSRLDELQAAILLSFLPFLDEWNSRRREIANYYSKYIKHENIDTPLVCEEGYVAHLYVIRSKYRDALREHLQQHDIASDVHYPIPDHKQPIFNGILDHIQLKNTETHSDL